MISTIIKKILTAIPVLLIVSIVLFLLLNVMPGDAADSISSADATAEEIEQLRESMGLNAPIYVQYLRWVKNVVKVALGSSLLALVLGSFLGLVSGYFGGALDEIVSGFMNSLWALPTIVLAMAINVALGTSLINILLSIGIVNIPGFYRIVRSRVISIKNMDYIMATKAIGQKTSVIIFGHVLPNLLSTLIVEATLCCSKAVIAESSLSFLGLGVQIPHASWGTMLKAGYPLISRAPWICVIPGLFIVTLVLGLNFLGDGLRDAFDVHLNAD